jgi:tRNA threonylcarbamoyladenosine biosynthesis protein TsaB
VPGGPVRAAPPDDRRHASGLLPAIAGLLRGAGLRAADLGAIGVGLGPGSFTGLRVGLAAAKALAYAVGCPLVGLDSLEAIARGAPADARTIRVAADAQRGELFAADFARDEPGAAPRRLGSTRIVAAEAWLGALAEGDLVLGPALDRPALAARLPAFVGRAGPDGDRPGAEALLALLAEAVAEGRRDDPFALEPTYLRRSAAEEKAGA